MDHHETIVCFHIPKTAGTSLVAEIGRFGVPWAHVMGGVYSAEFGMVVGTGQDYLLQKKDEALSGAFRIIIGHVTQRNVLSAFGRPDRFRYATILRDPVERVYSEYRYTTLSPAHPNRAFLAARYPTFEDFVEEAVDGNTMAHYLEDYRGEPVSRIVSRLLESYAFVGTIATYDEDIKRFRALFGVQDATPFRLNVSPAAPEPLSADVIAKVHERNARDVELYETFMSHRSDSGRS